MKSYLSRILFAICRGLTTVAISESKKCNIDTVNNLKQLWNDQTLVPEKKGVNICPVLALHVSDLGFMGRKRAAQNVQVLRPAVGNKNIIEQKFSSSVAFALHRRD